MATRAELVFDEYPDAVFTVTIAPVSMRAYFDFLAAWTKDSTIEETYGQIGTFEDLAHPEWTTGEAAFTDLDWALIRAIVNQWLVKVREVPLPLLVGSSGTGLSPVPETAPPANRSQRRANSRGRKPTTRS